MGLVNTAARFGLLQEKSASCTSQSDSNWQTINQWAFSKILRFLKTELYNMQMNSGNENPERHTLITD